MFGAFRAWRRRRALRNHPLDPALWQRVSSRFEFVEQLNASDRARLRDLCVLFLHEKQLSAAGGFVLDDEKKLEIAVQACVLILNLGIDSYNGWVEIIVYPDEFLPGREFRDEHGLIHTDQNAYSGQAWSRGPLILSWSGVERRSRHRGSNVVIHEFAHKLDMLNGGADGFPSLHADMNREQWTSAFSHAYEDLRQRAASGAERHLDDYGCQSPAEFFSVASEAFFESPEVLAAHYPKVYDQLVRFYRQNPAGPRYSRQEAAQC